MNVSRVGLCVRDGSLGRPTTFLSHQRPPIIHRLYQLVIIVPRSHRNMFHYRSVRSYNIWDILIHLITDILREDQYSTSIYLILSSEKFQHDNKIMVGIVTPSP